MKNSMCYFISNLTVFCKLKGIEALSNVMISLFTGKKSRIWIMKILVITLLMSVAACTSQPQNEYINNSGLEAKTKSSYSRSFEQNKQHIPVGTWEGIERSGAEFKVLKITTDNLHTFNSYKIATGMHHYKKISINNKYFF